MTNSSTRNNNDDFQLNKGEYREPELRTEEFSCDPDLNVEAGAKWVSVTPVDIEKFVSNLSSSDGRVREQARQSLVKSDGMAIEPLKKMLKNPSHRVRWEAAKALGQMCDPDVASVLVEALEDEDGSVRWLAGEGLIALKSYGLKALLEALIERSDSIWLREGAHHVLRNLLGGSRDEMIAPVVAALEDIQPALQVPLKAEKALVNLHRPDNKS